MEREARSAIRRKSDAVRIVFSVLLLGLVMMTGAVASLKSHPTFQTEQQTSVILYAAAMPQHDCDLKSGGIAGHCQLPSAVLGSASGNLPSLLGAFGNYRMLADLSRQTQHRPHELLRPPNVTSKRA